MSKGKNQPILSIVIPTKNNKDELSETLLSICKNCKQDIQIVIVDGGNENESKDLINNQFIDTAMMITYLHEDAKGVFPAQNMGIKSSIGEWIMILNSGDLLRPEARNIITDEYLEKYSEYKILVFSQTAYSDNNEVYKFIPSVKSIWPHQSILVRNEVYKEFGLYREDFKYGAEQFFFAVVRKKTPFLLINITITQYKLGGISSKMSFKHSNEIYEVKRELGENVFTSLFYSFITPYVRIMGEQILGTNAVNYLKRKIFKYYERT
jgi:glycosyltransferase involved in cell wall biosynthesis